MSDFIGVVDLTVRHSSMNPFGHIDVHEASRDFEQILLYACYDSLQRVGSESDAGRLMLERGIIVEGPAAKYFQFGTSDDAMSFALYLRSLLLEKSLPFKLCLTRGTLGVESLNQIWAPIIHAAQNAATKSEKDEASDKLLQQFGTSDAIEIADLFKTYRAPSLHQDAVSLALDLDKFKGFGIWIDNRLAEGDGSIKDKRLFRNAQPQLSGGAKHRWNECEFIDVRLTNSEEDVVVRRPNAHIELMPTGHSARIANVVDLLRRSLKAGEENGIYYLSLLSTIVRSSHFGSMKELDSAIPESEEKDAALLAAGWQNHPPIFQTLILDPIARSVFKRVSGIELALAAIIDEIHAASTDEPPSCEIQYFSRSTNLDDTEQSKYNIIMNAVTEPSSVFSRAVRRIEIVYGEAMLRKIWSVPPIVLNEERKRAALKVITSR